jgi:hypothetical protein
MELDDREAPRLKFSLHHVAFVQYGYVVRLSDPWFIVPSEPERR